MNQPNLTLSNTASIKQKIITLVIAVAVIASLSALAFSIKDLRAQLLKENKTKVSYATEMAYNIANAYKAKSDTGKMTPEQAKQLALQDIKAMNYAGSNYIWVNDYNYKFLSHPTKQGADGSTLEDKNGVKIIAESTNIAKSKGEGFLEYQWI